MNDKGKTTTEDGCGNHNCTGCNKEARQKAVAEGLKEVRKVINDEGEEYDSFMLLTKGKKHEMAVIFGDSSRIGVELTKAMLEDEEFANIITASTHAYLNIHKSGLPELLSMLKKYAK